MSDEQIARDDLSDIAASMRSAAAMVLRRVLAFIDAGEITADLDHVAYLRGAVAGLESSAGDRPDSLVSGHGAGAGGGGSFPQDEQSRKTVPKVVSHP